MCTDGATSCRCDAFVATTRDSRLVQLRRPVRNFAVRVAYAIQMSLGYDIYADIGLLYIRGQGVVTQSERMGAMLAWLRGRDPHLQVREALRRFKREMESGRQPTVEGQPRGRCGS